MLNVRRFLIGPIFVLISLFGIASYHREKIVNGVELLISFLAYVYLLVRLCRGWMVDGGGIGACEDWMVDVGWWMD